MTKQAIASLVQEMEESDVYISTDIYGGNLADTAGKFAQIYHEETSPCGRVAVLMAMDGSLVDVDIAEGSTKRVSHTRMAQLLTATIQSADSVVSFARKSHIRRVMEKNV